jgi:transposase
MRFVGIDWADAHHDAVILDEAGQQLAAIRVAHSAEGVEQLRAFLVSHLQPPSGERDQADLEQLACIIETSRGLLITALLEAGFAVYPVNPKTANRWRKPSGAKTDSIDALLLARAGRSDFADLHRLAPDSPLVHELKQLTRDQDMLIQMQTRLVNQLIACLKAYYPAALTLFTKIHQPLTLAFLQQYSSLEAAQVASLEDLLTFFRRYHHPHPQGAAHRVWQHLHDPQLHADTVTARTKERLMRVLVGQLIPLVEQIATYDKAIERLFAAHPDSVIFRSLPGAARRLAPRLFVGWGDDRERYASAASLQGLAGTSPVAFQSGKYAKAHKRSACVKPLRNALYQYAWQSTAHEEWALRYYRRKRQEGKSHSVALRALANLWVRLIHAMWLKSTVYDAATFVSAQRAHAKNAA